MKKGDPLETTNSGLPTGALKTSHTQPIKKGSLSVASDSGLPTVFTHTTQPMKKGQSVWDKRLWAANRCCENSVTHDR